MKRIIASLLAGLCLLALVGCSAGSKADSSAPKDYSQIIHDARTDEDNEYDMIFTKGEDGKFTAIDGYSAEYEADQLNDELKDIVFPLLGLEDGSYESFAASVSSMMVRSYAVAIVKPAEGKTEIDYSQQLRHPPRDIRPAPFAQLQAIADIARYRQVRPQGVALKYHGDIALLRRKMSDRSAGNSHLAALHRNKAAEGVQQRGFSASRRAQ